MGIPGALLVSSGLGGLVLATPSLAGPANLAASLPPFLPPVSGGSSCRGLPIGAWVWWMNAKITMEIRTEKHLWLYSR